MALTPNQLDKIPDNIVKIYQELEDFIMTDFIRRIKKTGEITDTAKYQVIKANEIGIALDSIKSEIKRVTDLSEKQIQELFESSGIASIEQENKIYKQANAGALNINNFKLKKILDAAIKQTNEELFNFTQSLGFAEKIDGKVVYKPIAKYYHDALDFAYFQIMSGATDYNKAIKNAIIKLSNSGIRYVNYESGWANRIDVAVRRATVTGANQMAQKMTIAGMEELGCKHVETTAHSGARPSHAQWQGKIFSWQGQDTRYPNFEESTGYGTGDGLGGWNCRHSFYPVFPDISLPTYSEEFLKNIDPQPFDYNGMEFTYYEATQYQRRIETSMRKSKRKLIMYKEAGLEKDFIQESIKFRRKKELYEDFSRAAGIRVKNERHQVLGFNKSISQKAVHASKKYT